MLFKKDRISSEYDIKVPKLIERTKRKAAVFTVVGEYGNQDYSTCWAKLWAFINQNKLFSMRMEFLGIYPDDPSTTPKEECRFKACVTINKDAEDGDEIKIEEIEGGRYLMFQYTGSYDNFRSVYDIIYNEYLADKDYKFRNAPWLEKYLNNPQKVEPKKLRTEIYIPIE
ncbi:MAG: GyrI-like domain-containing protein [Bacteroidales bacterium]|jgi:AraC family transcriptional regulator|nr:GyrI-like domain-containing protein [Bacteroidales bacterium]